MNRVGRWSRSFTVLGALDSDLISPVLAVSATNHVAVGSGSTDEDAPQSARAEVLTAGTTNVFAKQGLAQVQQTLAVGYLGSRLVLLDGSSPANNACCSAASGVSLGDGRGLGNADQFATGLEGTTIGALVAVHGGLLGGGGQPIGDHGVPLGRHRELLQIRGAGERQSDPAADGREFSQ